MRVMIQPRVGEYENGSYVPFQYNILEIDNCNISENGITFIHNDMMYSIDIPDRNTSIQLANKLLETEFIDLRLYEYHIQS